MKRIKKGDIVGRISYNKDIFFIVKDIKDKKNVLLEGVFVRIIADSDIKDLELIDQKEINRTENIIEQGITKEENRNKIRTITGKILHLDGDKRYSEKSSRYYQKMGINAVVKNVSEKRQPQVVYNLLEYYKPDILVITGHDGMFNKEREFYNIYNYRNSKYFIETVKEARRFERDYYIDLMIFAGACQSYFEAIIQAGANFASSPARILIDIMDPLKVARKIATTNEFDYIRIEDIEKELRDGRRGIGGIGAKRENEVAGLIEI
ncbi:MAG: sporulation peptidase YabG [Clostridia bacterium]|nr:sporulation peptidase YabG [Clostridia bacterium]